MSKPRNCFDCPYTKNCMAGMYTEGCKFYSPEEDPKNKNKKSWLKRIFSKKS